jgi:polyhydroxyalkanoate synthesis repressor PhaR
MPEPTETPTRKLEIKKYPNRRYYDATHSRHLTLDEIRSLIQQGYDLRVVDAKTNADITAQVLTQIILEHDTAKLDSLPVPLLVRLIRMNDSLIKDFIEKYFNQALQSFLDYQRQMEAQVRRTHGLTAAFPTVSAWTRAVLEPFATAFSDRTPGDSASPPFTDPKQPETQELRHVIRDLQQQVEELKRARPATSRPVRPRPKRGTPKSVTCCWRSRMTWRSS